MILKLNYFGQIAQMLHKEEEVLDLPVTTIRELKSYYAEKLQTIPFSVAVNQQLAGETDQLNENDEVALLPPFAGG
ncbi:MAG: MoaD/ThiS family protein [Flavobacteriales bacterium]|nr:MoaD/ThiS family protein [Flavobacteriales bacterium]